MTKLILLTRKHLIFAVFNFLLTFPYITTGISDCNVTNLPQSALIPEKTNHNFNSDDIIIVIDPGHGGKDSGTSYDGFEEKDIVLAIAKALRRKIEAAIPGAKVVLTRETDVFVPLYSRINISNKLNADVFISLHCNSFIEDVNVNGTEVHVLGLGSTSEKVSTAMRENASVYFETDREKHYDWIDSDSPEAFIFLSTLHNLFLKESIELAAKFSQSSQGRQIYKQRGVKQSGLLVLRNAAMPALMIEVGYLTNEKDRSIMTQLSGQNQIAAWIANVLMEHFIFDKKGLVMSKL